MKKAIATAPNKPTKHMTMKAPEVAERKKQEAAHDAEEKATGYIRKRQAEYPAVGDQLDAILKQLNSMRLGGTPMIQEMDDLLGEVLSIKAKHKKPTKAK